MCEQNSKTKPKRARKTVSTQNRVNIIQILVT
jgi:hypothetical protein